MTYKPSVVYDAGDSKIKDDNERDVNENNDHKQENGKNELHGEVNDSYTTDL